MSTRLLERAHGMLARHIEEHGGPVAWWRTSTATAKAMVDEYPGVKALSAQSTLFGSPLVLDDKLVFGAIDLVPDPNGRLR